MQNINDVNEKNSKTNYEQKKILLCHENILKNSKTLY